MIISYSFLKRIKSGVINETDLDETVEISTLPPDCFNIFKQQLLTLGFVELDIKIQEKSYGNNT